MDKGIRPAAIAKFAAMLPGRINTREGNTAFRKGVIAHLEEEFGITHAAGATHYNHAFIDAKKRAETDTALAELLVGLGRPEDKKGGRKPKAKPATTPSVVPTPASALLANFLKAIPPVQPKLEAPAVETPAAVETAQAEQTPEGDPNDAGETGTEQTLFTVKKKSDDSVVAEGLSLEDAKALVEAAAKAKKAKLYWV